MAGINKAILIGNLGKDPEVRSLEGGAKVATFSMATTETYKGKDGNRVDQTEWHNIVVWRGLAEIAEKYLHKGSPVYIEGRITNRSWTDKEGQKRYITEIVALNLTLLGGAKRDEGYSPPSVEDIPPFETGSMPVNDDLPF